MRTTQFAVREYFHVYNRAVDGRPIILVKQDRARFLRSMELFNVITPIGSIRDRSARDAEEKFAIEQHPLVHIICYCLNPNHYHFVLEQVAEDGVKKFMHRLGTGYTKYFNDRHQRKGSLFQGPFKAIRIDSDAYLLHVSAYVNLNMRVHRLRGNVSVSSWEEYLGPREGGGGKGLCQPSIVLDQFNGRADYERFALKTLKFILTRRGVSDQLLEQTIDLES